MFEIYTVGSAYSVIKPIQAIRERQHKKQSTIKNQSSEAEKKSEKGDSKDGTNQHIDEIV